MDIALLIKIAIGLVVLLILFVIFFLLPKKNKQNKEIKKTKKKTNTQKKEKKYTFDEILEILKNPDSTSSQLQEAIEQVIKHYIKIPDKIGIRESPEFEKYIRLIVYLVKHKNTTSSLIVKLDKELTKNNPSYKVELNEILNKALNTR
jgi:hypothetical protein